MDIERAQRINQTLALIPPEARSHSPLRPLELLVFAPSRNLNEMAARHVCDLPGTIRTLLRALGVRADRPDAGTGALASYLLFEPGYTRALMQLGWEDTFRQRAEVCRFFGWADRPR